jgi:hypothetical protein
MRIASKTGRQLSLATLLCSASLACCLAQTQAPAHGDKPGDEPQKSAAPRDGQHDFDFEFGTWKTHLKVLKHPLTGSTAWVEFDGTTVVHKIWHGNANMVELEVDGPSGHVEALNLRLYNPEAHQWSLNFANSKGGTMGVPTVGEFKNGQGEFYDQESVSGRTVLVRNIWSNITADSCHFEQAFSDDGGKTWETNWIATDTRIQPAAFRGRIGREVSPGGLPN